MFCGDWLAVITTQGRRAGALLGVRLSEESKHSDEGRQHTSFALNRIGFISCVLTQTNQAPQVRESLVANK